MNCRAILALLVSSCTALPLSAETVTQNYNGLTLNANLQKAEEKSAEAATVLITHGTLAHNGMDIIATLQSLLADNGHDSLAINLSLGVNNRTGMYDCATPHQHTHADAVTEIALWIDWLKQQDAAPLILMGHSRGGNQTALYADQQPDPRVKAQVLIAPQTWQETEAAQEYEARYKQPLLPLLEHAQQQNKDAWLENIGFIYCDNAKVSRESFIGYYQPDPRLDTPSLLNSATVPTLVFIGSEDTTVKNLASAMQDVTNPLVSHLQIEGADHFFRDLYADELVEHTIEFIEGL